jgi:F-type H+-transporting ATPase subunit delta
LRASADTKISKKYARALAHLKLDYKFYEDLCLVKTSFEQSKELFDFIKNPLIEAKIKKESLHRIFEWKIQQEILNLLYLLIDKKRFALFTSLADDYKEVFFERSNVQVAVISSTREIDPQDLEEIKSSLEFSFQKTVQLEKQIDSSLIAGLKLKWGTKVIDSSVKAKLKELRLKLEK